MEAGPEERLLGGDVAGEDIIYPTEPWEYRIGGKQTYMNIGRHVELPNSGEK